MFNLSCPSFFTFSRFGMVVSDMGGCRRRDGFTKKSKNHRYLLKNQKIMDSCRRRQNRMEPGRRLGWVGGWDGGGGQFSYYLVYSLLGLCLFYLFI